MINKITSLADLFFKAKTDERYQRLAIVYARRNSDLPIKTYEDALKFINEFFDLTEYTTCKYIISEINDCRFNPFVETGGELPAPAIDYDELERLEFDKLFESVVTQSTSSSWAVIDSISQNESNDETDGI